MRNDRLALLGIKHSGKSSVGRELSRKYEVPFVDTDDLISADHDGETPRNVMVSKGPAYFRQAEHNAISFCCSTEYPMILATGGGIADNGPALSTLSRHFTLIYLVENERVLYDRIMSGGIPPFLPENGTRAAFLRLYRRRDVTYRRWAHMIVDTHGKGVGAVADLVIRTHADLITGD